MTYARTPRPSVPPAALALAALLAAGAATAQGGPAAATPGRAPAEAAAALKAGAATGARAAPSPEGASPAPVSEGASPAPISEGASPAPKPGSAATAEGPDAAARELLRGRALAKLVQRYYARAKDFSAAFAQTYTSAALGRSKQSSGKVMVKRPGLLRWEYEQPEKKLLVLDGTAFWQWTPEDEQVVVNRHFQGGQLSSAFTFLWGKGELTREFIARAVPLPEALARVAGAQPQGLELVPKQPSAQIQRVVFAVGARGEVRGSLVIDSQDDQNLLVFSAEKTDSALADSLFKFAVPRGANVQELR